MKKVLVVFLAMCMAQGICVAQEVLPLYEGEIPGYAEEANHESEVFPGTLINVSYPMVKVYHPAEGKANGAAMVVCPGGGFISIAWADHEKTAEWLAEQGFTAVVLKYRLVDIGSSQEVIGKNVEHLIQKMVNGIEFVSNDVDDLGEPAIVAVHQAYDDARRAIELTREHAEEWGIDPHRVGIIGTSAGSMISAAIATEHTEVNRPDFVALLYGCWLPDRIGEERPVIVPEDAPLLFICSPVDDIFDPELILKVYRPWRASKKPVELHFFPYSMHGFNVGNTGDKNVGKWTDLMLGFMKDTGFLKE